MMWVGVVACIAVAFSLIMAMAFFAVREKKRRRGRLLTGQSEGPLKPHFTDWLGSDSTTSLMREEVEPSECPVIDNQRIGAGFQADRDRVYLVDFLRGQIGRHQRDAMGATPACPEGPVSPPPGEIFQHRSQTPTSRLASQRR